VDRVLRGSDKRDDALQPPLAEGNFEGRSGSKSKSADASDIGEKQVLKALVVGNVKKTEAFLAPGFGPLRFRGGGFCAGIAPAALSYDGSCRGFRGMDLVH
jgi:hypothetical protein